MIDVRGLSCPEPVIMVQKAMASGDSEYTVQSDSKTGRKYYSICISSRLYNRV